MSKQSGGRAPLPSGLDDRSFSSAVSKSMKSLHTMRDSDHHVRITEEDLQRAYVQGIGEGERNAAQARLLEEKYKAAADVVYERRERRAWEAKGREEGFARGIAAGYQQALQDVMGRIAHQEKSNASSPSPSPIATATNMAIYTYLSEKFSGNEGHGIYGYRDDRCTGAHGNHRMPVDQIEQPKPDAETIGKFQSLIARQRLEPKQEQGEGRG